MKKPQRSNKKHIFQVSIDDGLCEYTYPLSISQDYSIKEIMDKICQAFRVDKVEGQFRPPRANVPKDLTIRDN